MRFWRGRRRCWTVLLLLAVGLRGDGHQLEVNGDFERCVADRNGFPVPQGWQINQKISRDSTFQLTQEPADVCAGRFALRLSGTQEGAHGYVQFHESFPLPVGAVLTLAVQARGRGELALGYYAKGDHAELGPNRFIRTLVAPAQKLDSPEAWQALTFTLRLQPAGRDGRVYANQTLTPIIHWRGAADLLIDALTITLVAAEEKK